MFKLNKKNGFTLIEVLISILILAIALIGMIALVGVIVKGNANSKAVTTATTIAQERLEHLIRGDYDVISSGAAISAGTSTGSITMPAKTFNTINNVEVGTSTGVVTIYDKTYNLIERVNVGTPTTTSSTIEVEVYWGLGTSTTHKVVELQTVLAPK